MPFARRHVQVEHGVLFYHLAVRRLLPNHNATALYETVGRPDVHHRGAMRRPDTGHGRRVHALAVGSATHVFCACTEQVPENHVHMRRCRTNMFFVHPESGE